MSAKYLKGKRCHVAYFYVSLVLKFIEMILMKINFLKKLPGSNIIIIYNDELHFWIILDFHICNLTLSRKLGS